MFKNIKTDKNKREECGKTKLTVYIKATKKPLNFINNGSLISLIKKNEFSMNLQIKLIFCVDPDIISLNT